VIESPVAKRGREHPSLVSAAHVERIQEMVSDLALVDDGPVSVPEDRHAR
jgi:hypothetical protein